MKIAFVVNSVKTEQPEYTTSRLAIAAINEGHEVWYIGTDDFAYDTDEKIHARATSLPRKKYKSLNSFYKDLTGPPAVKERIIVDDLDILMLRNDPANDTGNRSWAQGAGIEFGRLAMRHGLIVINDPDGLAKAMNKMYFQFFPEEVRPRTLITRDKSEIRRFLKEEAGRCILKPLQGSGGQGIFLVDSANISNLNQMVEALSRDGYIIAQEYLPAAEQGDTRLFLMNGRPLKVKGKFAAFRRIRKGGDIRSNIHAGGSKAPAEIGDAELRLAEIVRPKLVMDGMFLVGLDIVGDKLMEINVFSPGGLGSARLFTKVNFSRYVIRALDRKVQYMKYYKRNYSNVQMATLQ